MSVINEKRCDDATLAFRSIAGIVGDILANKQVEVELSEKLWAIQFMAETMADRLDGVVS